MRAVRKLQRRGVRNIDVGCMQVNLRYHPKAFKSLGQAFDPRANAAYAAGFLRKLRDKNVLEPSGEALSFRDPVLEPALPRESVQDLAGGTPQGSENPDRQ